MPEAKVIAGYAYGDRVAQGRYFFYFDQLTGNTSHFHQFQEQIVVLEGTNLCYATTF